jgi:phosphoglycolate phosphatase
MKELSDKEIPEDWRPRLIKKVSVAWRTQLNAIEGVEELLVNLEIPVCVASNGEPTHINQSLEMTGLSDFFDGNIFSAADIGVPKPAPDLFLYAAEKMGFKPEECIVVEDSVTGVTAAKRANMKVYGFGNSRTIGHISSAEELQNAGAIPFTKMQELADLLGI